MSTVFIMQMATSIMLKVIEHVSVDIVKQTILTVLLGWGGVQGQVEGSG